MCRSNVLPGGELNLIALWPALWSPWRRNRSPRSVTLGFRGEFVLVRLLGLTDVPDELLPAVRCLQAEWDSRPYPRAPRADRRASGSTPLSWTGSPTWGVRFQLNSVVSWWSRSGSMTRLLAEEVADCRDRYLVDGHRSAQPRGPARAEWTACRPGGSSWSGRRPRPRRLLETIRRETCSICLPVSVGGLPIDARRFCTTLLALRPGEATPRREAIIGKDLGPPGRCS